MTELVIYIIIAIIWAIVSLIQKATKQNQKYKTKQKQKTYSNRKFNNNKNEEEIFKELQKNIRNLKNYNEEVLRENTRDEDVYTNYYETSNNDREILELQEKYNSKIAEINSIREENYNNAFNDTKTLESRNHVNHMLSSLDIKNAIIYNAILEPRRIKYMKIKNSKFN
ncbi:hypothetical protein [Brachyspira hyodysenteriae]|uniref:hypothetical protein n=1 Tax=Brachyspira hyodysenteriae TaxID=159 RepID=UPI001182BF86|nr:hypothetical protein [Brachyspira hyodysenteriae]TVL60320.1 hypothetical protein A9X83_04765 [Brachyspira hyodysenteriae]